MKAALLDHTEPAARRQDVAVLVLSVVVIFIGLLLIGSPGVVV
jgi:hypothetical protein